MIRPSGGGLWRKNRRLISNGIYGVDLNRNFGFRWGFDNIGSSFEASSEVYRGAGPFSEPESRVLRDFCLGRNFKVALNYHSYGGLLIYPFGYDNSETADSLVFRDLGRELTKENGYNYGTGEYTIGYVANGAAEDWMYGAETAQSSILCPAEFTCTGWSPGSFQRQENLFCSDSEYKVLAGAAPSGA